MRVLVCGGRNYCDQDYIWNTLTALDVSHGPFTCLIHGAATGADTEAMIWAQTVKGVKHAPFVAEWVKYGKAAGAMRNQRMLREGKPDLVVAFPGGIGTANMVRIAKAAGVEVVIIAPRGTSR